MTHPTFFVSYRRDDAAAEAGRIADSVAGAFGVDAVFMDVSGVEAGGRWPDELQRALDGADLMIAVLGPEWLRMGDEYGIRRIDQPDDWVRREIETFLLAQKKIIPVLVRGAKKPPAGKLPASVRELASLQNLEIRRDYWDHDITLLTSVLGSHHGAGPGPGRSTSGPYPVPPPEVPDQLSDEKITVALNGTLSQWTWVASMSPEAKDGMREELCRDFRFRSFRDAIAFMAEVAPGCDIAIHHPRWENIFRTVFVRLSTWDIGHRISDRDIQLAKYFDQAYLDHVARSTAARRA